jgi:DNA-binding NtrC family response regulator
MRAVSLQVISATDAPLDSDDCDFRAALRHRLGSLEIRLLPLRDHPEDIGELAVHFLVAESASLQRGAVLPEEHSSQMEIARWAELFHQLLRYRWPGNVRELANACRQVIVESDAGIAVPERIRSAVATARRDGGQDGHSVAGRSMREVGDSEFERAWEQSGYEPAGTARLLGVSRQSVYRRIDGSDRHRLASQVSPGELRRVLERCDGDISLAARRLRVSQSALRAVLRNAGPDRY